MVTFVLLVVGGLNWGLTAVGWNAVEAILGSWPMVVTIVYAVVGLSALHQAFTHKSDCKACATSAQM